MKYIVAILLLMAAPAGAWWNDTAPFCHNETWHSLTETAVIGAGIPSGLCWAGNKIWPNSTPDTKRMRTVAVHLACMGGMAIFMRGKALTDGDSRYTNPMMLCYCVSLPLNLFIGGCLK